MGRNYGCRVEVESLKALILFDKFKLIDIEKLCSECDGIMKPYHSKNTILNSSVKSYKETQAFACEDCGLVKFYLKDKLKSE